MKKICWISAYLPDPTPFASISYMMIKELLKLNKFEITLITFNDKPINADLPIKIYPIIEKGSFYAIVKALQILKKENFDIIHIMSARFSYKRLFYTITFLAKFILRVKSKIIISAHEFYDFSNLRELIIGGLYHLFLLRFSDRILVFNREFQNMILSKSVYKKKKENIIFLSKNVQAIRYEEISPTKKWEMKSVSPFILFFGFLRIDKGLQYLIKAFALVQEALPNLKLIIAGGISKGTGSKNYYLYAKKLVLKLNLVKKVIFTDYISWEEIMELFKLAQIVVYPSLKIDNSSAIFPALYSKKAIICSDITGLRQVFTNGKDCLFAKPKNASDIAKKIIKILKNDDLKNSIEKGAGKLYLNNSFEKLCNKYNDVFSE